MWFRWLEQQWNTPNRADYYAMQIAAEIRRGYLEKGQKVTLDELKIPFKSSTKATDRMELTPEEDLQQRKQMWMGMLGGRVRGWDGK